MAPATDLFALPGWLPSLTCLPCLEILALTCLPCLEILAQVAYGHVTVHLGAAGEAGRRADDDHFTLHWQGKTPSSPLYTPWPAGKRLPFPKFEDA